MSRRRTWTLGIFGILLPVALAMTAYLISSWGDAPANSSPGIEFHDVNQDAGKSKEIMESPGTADDHGDRCSEPEHRDDPTCTSTSSGSGSTVSGTDDSGGGGSGKNGAGSDDSNSGGSSGTSGSGSGSTSGGPGPSPSTSDDSGHSGGDDHA